MAPVKILIVEDQLLIAEDTAQRLKDLGYEVTAVARNSTEAMDCIQKNIPDVILMDIKLDGPVDGIELAARINKKNAIPIIYLSEYEDLGTVEKAKNIHNGIYMSKPFNDHILDNNIEVALNSITSTPATPVNWVFLRENHNSGRRVKVVFDDICYIKAGRSYCEVYVKNASASKPGSLKKYVPSVSMGKFTKSLSPDFVQVHRSFVVNFKYVEAQEDNDLVIGNALIPIGDNFKTNIKELLRGS